jgi:hypothetical protein
MCRNGYRYLPGSRLFGIATNCRIGFFIAIVDL